MNERVLRFSGYLLLALAFIDRFALSDRTAFLIEFTGAWVLLTIALSLNVDSEK